MKIDETMLREITLADHGEIDRHLHRSDRQFSDFSFTSQFCWRHIYGNQWLVVDDLLIFYSGKYDFIIMPSGREVTVDELIAISDAFRKFGKKGNFATVDIDFVESHKPLLDRHFTAEIDDNYSDYIYRTDKLAALKGDKLRKKKNLISQFIRNHSGHRIVPLAESHLDDCFKLADKWCEFRNCEEFGIKHEQSAMAEALHHFTSLRLEGLLLMTGDAIAAFTIFGRQNRDTFTIHYEKYDGEIKGAAQMINWETAKYLQDKCTYLNREQDMGVDGLRQAKRSYDPEYMLRTYALYRR